MSYRFLSARLWKPRGLNSCDCSLSCSFLTKELSCFLKKVLLSLISIINLVFSMFLYNGKICSLLEFLWHKEWGLYSLYNLLLILLGNTIENFCYSKCPRVETKSFIHTFLGFWLSSKPNDNWPKINLKCEIELKPDRNPNMVRRLFSSF